VDGSSESTTTGRLRKAYVLRIDLADMPYPVWRRIVVDAGTTLHGLHHAIQMVMPWQDYHLYSFTMEGVDYANPDIDEEELEYADSTAVHLLDLGLAEGQRLTYLYDFGDHWVHTIQVEKVLEAEGGALPRCVDGQGACPPEDVGGIAGVKRFWDAIQDPTDPEREEYRTWAGGEFDPGHVDLTRLDARMRPDEYWKTHTPRPGLDTEEYVGLWFGYADEVFLQELARHRSSTTVAKYKAVLQLFRAFAAGDQDISAWPEVTADHFARFLGDFVPRQTALSASAARDVVSGVAGFVRWLDRTYGTKLGDIYAQVRSHYQDALPRAMRAADRLFESVWQDRSASLLEPLGRGEADAFANLPAVRRQEPVPVGEGFWDVVETREDGTVLLSEDVVQWTESRVLRPAPGGLVTIRISEEVCQLLAPGSRLYLALGQQGRQWVLLESGAVLPPP
jgi:hypothetical protein